MIRSVKVRGASERDLISVGGRTLLGGPQNSSASVHRTPPPPTRSSVSMGACTMLATWRSMALRWSGVKALYACRRGTWQHADPHRCPNCDSSSSTASAAQLTQASRSAALWHFIARRCAHYAR